MESWYNDDEMIPFQDDSGLLTVVVQDLTLTIKPRRRHSKNVKVRSDHCDGRYPVSTNKSDGSITVSFGSLYSKEMRKILVGLTLPEVNVSKKVDILKCTYSYKEPRTQRVVEPPPIYVKVNRKKFASSEKNLEVSLEKARQQTVVKMRDAMEQADRKEFEKAKATVNEALNDLKDNDNMVVSNPNIKALISELRQFSKYLKSPEIYKNLGRAFVLPALLSHELQRFASKGNANKHRLFATDAMNLLLDQVHKFESDSSYKVPTPDQDREELKKSNLVADIPACQRYSGHHK